MFHVNLGEYLGRAVLGGIRPAVLCCQALSRPEITDSYGFGSLLLVAGRALFPLFQYLRAKLGGA